MKKIIFAAALLMMACSTARAQAVIPSSTPALASSLKASGGALYGFEVAADSTLSGAPWWIMVFNSATARPKPTTN